MRKKLIEVALPLVTSFAEARRGADQAEKRNAPFGASDQRCYRQRGALRNLGLLSSLVKPCRAPRADSDLAPAVEAVRAGRPGKRVIVASPPDRESKKLESVATASFRIGRKKLVDSQLPDDVVKPDGFILRRPAKWS